MPTKRANFKPLKFKTMTKEQENKRIFQDYMKFKDISGRHNRGVIDNDVFHLIRIKDGKVLTSFNIHTFKPLD